jgi:hypothetical protein
MNYSTTYFESLDIVSGSLKPQLGVVDLSLTVAVEALHASLSEQYCVMHLCQQICEHVSLHDNAL